jgi:putative chitobiose transport system permease protein
MTTLTSHPAVVSAAKEQRKMSILERRRTLVAYLFMVPALAILIVFLVIPLLQVVYLSFTEYDILTAPKWVGLDNYSNLFSDELFWSSLGRSFAYLLVTPVLIVLSLSLAIVVNRPLRGITFFRSLYYLPTVISVVSIGMIFNFVFAEPAGLINGMLKQLGLIDQPIHFLTRPDNVLGTIMSVTVWRGVGYYMVMFLAGLQAIPEELYEAAAIDGATKLQQHWYVTVPSLRPIITFVAIISSIAALRAFDEIFIMTDATGGVLNSAVTSVYYLYRQAFQFHNYGYASAIAVIVSCVIMAFSLINLRFLEGKHNV